MSSPSDWFEMLDTGIVTDSSAMSRTESLKAKARAKREAADPDIDKQQEDDLRQAEQKKEEIKDLWEPSPEEQAAIREREIEEAKNG